MMADETWSVPDPLNVVPRDFALALMNVQQNISNREFEAWILRNFPREERVFDKWHYAYFWRLAERKMKMRGLAVAMEPIAATSRMFRTNALLTRGNKSTDKKSTMLLTLDTRLNVVKLKSIEDCDTTPCWMVVIPLDGNTKHVICGFIPREAFGSCLSFDVVTKQYYTCVNWLWMFSKTQPLDADKSTSAMLPVCWGGIPPCFDETLVTSILDHEARLNSIIKSSANQYGVQLLYGHANDPCVPLQPISNSKMPTPLTSTAVTKLGLELNKTNAAVIMSLFCARAVALQKSDPTAFLATVAGLQRMHTRVITQLIGRKANIALGVFGIAEVFIPVPAMHTPTATLCADITARAFCTIRENIFSTPDIAMDVVAEFGMK